MRQTIPSSATVAALLACAAAWPAAAAAAEFATVVASTPVIAQVPVSRQRCDDAQQLVQPAPSGAGSLIGAIAGGVIGNSVGGGFGRAAATGVGIVAGSVIGNQVEANTTPPVEVPVRRCRNVSAYEDRVVGYDVMYEYAGQRYSTRLARDPGRQLAVSVQPAQADGGSAPTPVFDDDRAAQPRSVPQRVYYDDEPAPRTVYIAPSYDSPYDSPYYAPYYAPYYVGPSVYVAPLIGFGFGYYGGHFGGHSGGHRGGHRGGGHWR